MNRECRESCVKRLLYAGLALSLAVLLPLGAHAQIGTSGTFLGTVQDTSGAVIPGVTVRATHVATGASQSATSDARGQYRIASLPLGEFKLEATHPGFQSVINTGLTLTVGKSQEVNFTLQVGEVSQTVTVEGGAQLVETTSSTVASLVGSQEVSELPLNGRSFDQLIALSAGAILHTERLVNAYRGFNSYYSVGGSRPADTKLIVDGTEFQGGGSSDTNIHSASGKTLGVDGIQEFVVVTNNGDATYGKKMGGQVNIVTRAGTNDYHGTVFEFLRNNIFDARNFFDAKVLPLRRNNFGFAVGGPIVKDRTFFFTNYEKLIEKRSSTLTFNVPDQGARSGILPISVDPPQNNPSGPIPCTVAGGTPTADRRCQLRLNPGTQPILNFFPLPNTGRNFGDGTAEASYPGSLDIRDTFGVARIDHHFSQDDTIFGRYMVQSGERQDGSLGVALFTDTTPARVQLATAGYTRIVSPQLVNIATMGFNRGYMNIDSAALPGVSVPSAMFIMPGETKAGIVAVGTGTQGNPIPSLGGGTAGTSERFVARNLYQLNDQLSYTHSAHSFQFGGGMQRIQSNEFQGSQKRGFLTFPGIEALITGVDSLNRIQVRGPIPGSDGFKSWRQTFWDFYVQDNYRVTRTFILNLGLRFEFMTNPREKYGRIAQWVPAGNQLAGVYPDAPSSSEHLFTDNHSGNFAPRIGFAWDVFGTGRTAVRAGMGVFYSQIENDFRGQQSSGTPFWNQGRVNSPPFPNPGSVIASAGTLSPLSSHQFPDIPTMLQYNLRIEQTIAPETVLAVAYVGSHASHLVRATNPQVPEPVLNAAGRLEVRPGLVNPRVGNAAVFQVWDANAFYNSLQTEVEKRLSRGLRFKSAFTWSKSIDDAFTPILEMTSRTRGDRLHATDHKNDRGRSSFDAGLRWVSNWDYELPFGTHSGALGHLIADWRLGGILTLSNGFPLTAQIGFDRRADNVGGGLRPDLASGGNLNPVLGGPVKYFDPTNFVLPAVGIVGNVGESTINGPGLVTTDFSVSKNFTLTERMRLMFRSEFFNLFNRANFSQPNGNLFNTNGSFSGSAGRIQSTATTSREIQLGLKLTF